MFVTAVTDYWRAVEQPGDPPELVEFTPDAFIDLLQLTAQAKHAFAPMPVVEDVYPAIAVGDESKPWHLHWAIQVGEMEPFVSPDLPEIVFLVDTIADPDGNHRVYTLKDDVRGDLEFAGLAPALRWMAGQVRVAKKELTKAQLEPIEMETTALLDDDWEDGPTSGWYVLEELLNCPLSQAWDAISRGQWPMVEGGDEPAPDDREDGWQRRLSLWLTTRFIEKRHVELPADVSVSDMDTAHRALVDHLLGFEQAIHGGEVPLVIEQVAEGDDKAMAQLAQDWIQRHDSWRTVAVTPSSVPDDFEEEEPPPFQHTPFTRQLMAALSASLDRMTERGELELDPDRKEALLIEMVTAASDARSVGHMLKKLTATLVESEHVEEIYPSDDRIQDRLKEDLGGG